MMRFLAAFLILAATGFMPVVSAVGREGFTPPPRAATGIISMGRREAAGVVYWILAAQMMGSDRAAYRGYPGLEKWLLAVFDNNPYLRDAYVLGTVVLLVDAERGPIMQDILVHAEARFPTEFQFPMLRGISSYFGALDADAAAGHFARASTLPNAPPFLGRFAERLRTDNQNCGAMLVNLKTTAEHSAAKVAFARQAGPIMERCIKRELEQAAVAFKFRFGSTTTLDGLLQAGLLKEPPPSPPGMCWSVINVNAYLSPCEQPGSP